MIRIPSGARLVSLLLTLAAYHGTVLLPSFPFSSSSPLSSPSSRSSLASAMSPPYWLPSLKSSLGRQEIGEEEFRVNQARLGSSSASLKRSQTCRPSSDQQRLAEMLNVMETLEQLDPENLNQLMRIRAQHNLTGVCPTFQPSEQLRGLEHQSLCPWTLEENYQGDRFPRLLWYARCICGHCTGAGWGSSMRLYSCVPLYHRVAVIREVCIDGEIHFRWGRESVPVGCVCAHPTARQVD